ncbi:CpaF family protein [Nocardioides zeae]
MTAQETVSADGGPYVAGPRPTIDVALVDRVHSRVADGLQSQQSLRRERGEAQLDGAGRQQYVRHLLKQEITRLTEDRLLAGLPPLRVDDSIDEEAELHAAVQARMFGAGQLQALLDDESVQDIFINGCDSVFALRVDGTKDRLPAVAASDAELVDLVQTLGAYTGLSARAWDAANPRVLLRLPGGARLTGVMGVTERPSVSIRRHTAEDWTLSDHVAAGAISGDLAAFLTACVAARLNIVVAGATGSGKTSLLRSLAEAFEPRDRVVTVESAFELGLDRLARRHPDCVALEERLPNSEGNGAVPLADCMRMTLHMKPDRIVLGEVLGPEVVTMLNAMTQGNNALSTIHARSAVDVFARIATYAAQSVERLPRDATLQLIAAGVDLVVFLRQDPATGHRRVSEVVEVAGYGEGNVLSSRLFELSPEGPPSHPGIDGPQRATAVWTGVIPQRVDQLLAAGWAPPSMSAGQEYEGWRR